MQRLGRFGVADRLEQRGGRKDDWGQFVRLATDRQMIEYIRDQDRGEKWDPAEVHVARFEWHSAMNGLELIDAPTVRKAMENYRDAINHGLGAISQRRSNRKRWTQMTDVLGSSEVRALRRRLEDAMRADAGSPV